MKSIYTHDEEVVRFGRLIRLLVREDQEGKGESPMLVRNALLRYIQRLFDTVPVLESKGVYRTTGLISKVYIEFFNNEKTLKVSVRDLSRTNEEEVTPDEVSKGISRHTIEIRNLKKGIKVVTKLDGVWKDPVGYVELCREVRSKLRGKPYVIPVECVVSKEGKALKLDVDNITISDKTLGELESRNKGLRVRLYNEDFTERKGDPIDFTSTILSELTYLKNGEFKNNDLYLLRKGETVVGTIHFIKNNGLKPVFNFLGN